MRRKREIDKNRVRVIVKEYNKTAVKTNIEGSLHAIKLLLNTDDIEETRYVEPKEVVKNVRIYSAKSHEKGILPTLVVNDKELFGRIIFVKYDDVFDYEIASFSGDEEDALMDSLDNGCRYTTFHYLIDHTS